jgi:hypothetical protein
MKGNNNAFVLWLSCLLKFILHFVTAITTVVTIAEILKNNGLATEKSKNYLLLTFTFLYS